jgi:hypothetical protein
MTKATKSYVFYDIFQNLNKSSNCVALEFSFKCIDLHHNPVNITLNLRNLYTLGAIRLKILPLNCGILMVNTFGTIGSIAAVNFIVFRGVAPFNLVD